MVSLKGLKKRAMDTLGEDAIRSMDSKGVWHACASPFGDKCKFGAVPGIWNEQQVRTGPCPIRAWPLHAVFRTYSCCETEFQALFVRRQFLLCVDHSWNTSTIIRRTCHCCFTRYCYDCLNARLQISHAVTELSCKRERYIEPVMQLDQSTLYQKCLLVRKSLNFNL